MLLPLPRQFFFEFREFFIVLVILLPADTPDRKQFEWPSLKALSLTNIANDVPTTKIFSYQIIWKMYGFE